MPKDLVINNGKLDTTKLVGAPNVRQINYILNADAEVDISGWATYADAAQSTPVDGTGGSPQASLWIRSTTTPLRGVGSFRLDKTGSATRQGQGASYAFTIDKADTAKVLTVSFDYEVVSGTYADGDLTVYIYDVTNATVIQPAGFSIPNVASGVENRVIATFQTHATSTSYRLILHVASASTQNYTLAFDNVTVGPQTVQYGAPITDWVTYTPTITNLSGFASGYPTAKYRRVGDSIEIDLNIRKNASAGTGSSQVRVSLPSGLTIDTAKTTGNACVYGHGYAYDVDGSGAIQRGGIAAAFDQAPHDTFRIVSHTSGYLIGTDFAANSELYLRVTVPISGFGSSVVMSDTTDTRVVIAQFGSSTANLVVSGSAGVNIIWPSVNFDTHGSYNTSTGIYTVPVPGYYKVSISEVYTPTAGSHYLNLHKNGNYLQNVVMYAQISGTVETGSTVAFFNAGDQVSIRSSSNHTIEYGASAYRSKVTIERISGPSSIAATETVALSVSKTSTQNFVNATSTDVTGYATPSLDTHSIFNVTTGIATIPVSGLYQIHGAIMLDLYTASGNSVELIIRVDNTSEANGILSAYSVNSRYWQPQVTYLKRLIAGQQVKLVLFHDSGSTRATYSGGGAGQYNRLSIVRVGN